MRTECSGWSYYCLTISLILPQKVVIFWDFQSSSFVEVKPSVENLLTIWFAGFFLTKIFHPNIATSGEICVNTLKKDWNPGLGLRHVLLVRLTFNTHKPVHYFICSTTKFLCKQLLCFWSSRPAGYVAIVQHGRIILSCLLACLVGSEMPSDRTISWICT